MAKYQRRHYEDMAKLLRSQRSLEYGPEADDAVDTITEMMVELFKGDNAKFSKLRFLEASGYMDYEKSR